MRRKLVPSDELTILPSLEDYAFFERADAFPFASNAGGFNMVNAWWTAEASMLAYREPDAVAEVLDDTGVMRSESIIRDGTRCYILQSRDAVVVAFRATELAVCDALQETADPDRSRMRPFAGGQAYGPFVEAFERIWQPLSERIAALRADNPARPVWTTGHGHGGALATLAAVRGRGVSGAYTFGCPRFVDARFARACPPAVYRIVHNQDFAPRMPPALPAYVPGIGGRAHAGEARFIDRRGRVVRSLSDCLGSTLDRAAGSLKDRVETLRSCGWAMRELARPTGRLPVPWSAMRDHAPIYYAVHLWNALVEGRDTEGDERS